jgi:hypothetical protein
MLSRRCIYYAGTYSVSNTYNVRVRVRSIRSEQYHCHNVTIGVKGHMNKHDEIPILTYTKSKRRQNPTSTWQKKSTHPHIKGKEVKNECRWAQEVNETAQWHEGNKWNNRQTQRGVGICLKDRHAQMKVRFISSISFSSSSKFKLLTASTFSQRKMVRGGREGWRVPVLTFSVLRKLAMPVVRMALAPLSLW